MILNGPFNSVSDYIGDVHVVLTEMEPIYEIVINDSNLATHKFLRYFFKQDLKPSHKDSIVNYIKIGDDYTVLAMKPNPMQTFDYIEERIRLSSTQLSGKPGITIGFRSKNSHLFLKNLMFGPTDTDDANLTTGITVNCFGGGAISPSTGFNPVAVGELLEVKLYPFYGYTVNKIESVGDLYDENGIKVNKYITPVDNKFILQLKSCFDSGMITVEFRRL